MSKTMKILYILCVFLFVIAIIIAASHFLYKYLPAKEGQLSIDSIVQEDCTVKIYPEYALIPINRLLSGLDYSPNWTSDSAVTWTKDGKSVCLDLAQGTLTDSSASNLLTTPPGCENYYCERSGNELWVDSTTINAVLNLMDEQKIVAVDYLKATVNIV